MQIYDCPKGFSTPAVCVCDYWSLDVGGRKAAIAQVGEIIWSEMFKGAGNITWRDKCGWTRVHYWRQRLSDDVCESYYNAEIERSESSIQSAFHQLWLFISGAPFWIESHLTLVKGKRQKKKEEHFSLQNTSPNMAQLHLTSETHNKTFLDRLLTACLLSVSS